MPVTSLSVSLAALLADYAQSEKSNKPERKDVWRHQLTVQTSLRARDCGMTQQHHRSANCKIQSKTFTAMKSRGTHSWNTSLFLSVPCLALSVTSCSLVNIRSSILEVWAASHQTGLRKTKLQEHSSELEMSKLVTKLFCSQIELFISSCIWDSKKKRRLNHLKSSSHSLRYNYYKCFPNNS